jgi:L-aminopeptidase/D-esterase-like protein
MPLAMKGGIGSASIEIARGLLVGALAAVNAFGDVVDPSTNQISAGVRTSPELDGEFAQQAYFADTLRVLKSLAAGTALSFGRRSHTVIGVVATNAALNKEQANKVAQMAQDGLARTVRPAHTMLDGDTIFALSTGRRKADINIVGAFAAEVFAQAILRAVRAAQPVAGLPTASQRFQG